MQRIALVDDDEDILTSVSIALELEGYKVAIYRDGASALTAFKTSPPDLAVLQDRPAQSDPADPADLPGRRCPGHLALPVDPLDRWAQPDLAAPQDLLAPSGPPDPAVQARRSE